MEFRNWNLKSPQDVDTFDSETQNNHRDSSNTIYAVGYEPQVRVNRKQFLAHLRELTQEETTAGTWEAWACQEYQGGGPTLFECWMSPTLDEQIIQKRRRMSKMSEATQQDSESNKAYFHVRWPGGSPTKEEFLMMLPLHRSLTVWESTIINGEECIAWDTLKSDMREVSTQYPNTIFTVEITDEDSERWVEYHQNGQHYEAPEVRHIPDFDPSRMRETQHPDPLDLSTPIVQAPPTLHVPTLQDVLRETLLVIEQNVWKLEVDQRFDDGLPEMANPYESHGKPFTSPEAALERIPRLREILTATHQECNQFGETTEQIKDIFDEHVVQVLNHRTFAERRELKVLALETLTLETLTAKNTKPTTEE